MMFSIFLIFTGAAVLATVALYARQSLLMAYILLGAIVGPAGFGMVDDPQLIEDIAHVGIIFLLFLLGLDLYPKKLLQLLKEATLVMMARRCYSACSDSVSPQHSACTGMTASWSVSQPPSRVPSSVSSCYLPQSCTTGTPVK